MVREDLGERAPRFQPEIPARIRLALERARPRTVADEACSMRAAVALILSEQVPESKEAGVPAALFVRRADLPGDPWAGHVALPGGRTDAADANLVETARRETAEETGIHLAREDFLGRLDDILPRSRHLPSIAVTPFVAWLPAPQKISLNQELSGYLWVPLSSLSAQEFRSTLRLEMPSRRDFPAIDIAGDIIWGLTLAIVENFLLVLERGGVFLSS